MERVPVLKIGNILLASIQVDMDDQTALRLQEDLSERIVTTGCHGVIIDITALDIVDSFIGRMLATIASISRVLDAETVVVGMRPAVAITLVELGLSLPGIRTALNVERGMELIAAARDERGDEAAAEWDTAWLDPEPAETGPGAGGAAEPLDPGRAGGPGWAGGSSPAAASSP